MKIRFMVAAMHLILLSATAFAELSHLRPWQDIHQNSLTGERVLSSNTFQQEENTFRWRFDPPLEFTNAFQSYIVDASTMQHISSRLDGITSMTVGGWFYCRRTGEQTFFCRGVPVIAPDGERVFTANEQYVSFCLGMDQHGFLLGTIQGNGSMPFPYVTINELYINSWNHIAVVKDEEGHHRFYINGVLLHEDSKRIASGYVRPFVETISGGTEPIRISMPMGGKIAEIFLATKELSPDAIRREFQNKMEKYQPIVKPIWIPFREMDAHYDPYRWAFPASDYSSPTINLRPQTITQENWTDIRASLKKKLLKNLGEFPMETVPLDPEIISETDCGHYVRRKVSFAVQPEDRMPGYLLIPKGRKGRLPVIICMYGTSSGAGKDNIVGLSGRAPGTPPKANESFALDMVDAGFIAFAPDWLRDGERIRPGERPYELTSFNQRFPKWTFVGKDAWDTSRAIDYLQSLDIVDPDRIGMTGHSYGAGGTIHAAALDTRIQAVVANGPVSQPRTYHEVASLIAPRPMLVGQAVGERRPEEEEIHAAVREVYTALGYPERVRYLWYAGDHDYPPEARRAAVEWFKNWFEVE